MSNQDQINERTDVVIVGGGLAGLCLGVQIKRARPDIRIVVLEKRKHPVPEVAHKVGESTVEIAGRYFADVVGMRDHLEEHQLLKPGLRFYFPAGRNDDITKRTELGFTGWPKYPTYQIDRGRFENALGREAVRLGVDFRDGSKVADIAVSEDGDHAVTCERGGESSRIGCRWLVDASGRTGLLRRRLGLAVPVEHEVGAAWFRVTEPIDIDQLSDDPKWRARSPEAHLRRLSTNHLMGSGYWFWLIPLAGGDNGSTSFGIVAETNLHPFDTFNTRERALAWLDRNEPQMAEQIRAHEDAIVDFHTLRRYAYNCKRGISPSRWALVGEAGSFTDPFLSPGSDAIYVHNTLVTNLILMDMGGGDISEVAEHFNEMYLGWFDAVFATYRNQYPMYGNTQVMSLKLLYDYYYYEGNAALLGYHDRLADVEFYASIADEAEPADELYKRMQGFFRAWNELDDRPRKPSFYDQFADDSLLFRFHCGIGDELADDRLRERLFEHFRLIRHLSVAIFRHAVRCCFPERAALVDGRPINPYAISLAPDRWERDGLFDERHALEVDRRVQADVSRLFYEIDDDPGVGWRQADAGAARSS